MNDGARPVCSVCVANYNGEHLLDDCLASVLDQDCGFAFEVIVHDDASTDGSVALLRERYPQVHLLVSDRNVGFCRSNNRMVQQARGEFVLLLNNDATLHRDALATLHAASGPGASILTLPQYDWQSGELVDLGCRLDPFYTPVPRTSPQDGQLAYVIGACLWVPRSVWVELGGFPEWMESIAEDLYLCGLARLRGIPVRVTDRSGYRHRQGYSFGGNRMSAAGLRSSYRRRFFSERNRAMALFLLTPSMLMWPWLAVHLCALLLEGALLALLRLDLRIASRIYVPAVGSTITLLPRMAVQRSEIQRLRRIGLRSYLGAFTLLPRKLALLLRHGPPGVGQ